MVVIVSLFICAVLNFWLFTKMVSLIDPEDINFERLSVTVILGVTLLFFAYKTSHAILIYLDGVSQ